MGGGEWKRLAPRRRGRALRARASRVERRRRKDRGAEGADVGVGRGCPLPTAWVWEGAVTPLQKKKYRFLKKFDF